MLQKYTKSLAERHQSLLCYKFLTSNVLLKEMKVSKSKLYCIHNTTSIHKDSKHIAFWDLTENLPYFEVLRESSVLTINTAVYRYVLLCMNISVVLVNYN